MTMRTWLPAIVAALSFAAAAEYRAPAESKPPMPRPGALSILPGGRMLEPYGHQYPTGPGTFRIAVGRRGRLIATADTGPGRYSVTLLHRDERGWVRVQRLDAPEEGTVEGQSDSWRTVSMGITFTDDDRLLVAEGASGNVRWMKVATGERIHLFELNRPGLQNSFSGDLAYDGRRKLLYVLDPANGRLVVFDVGRRRPIGSVALGPLPFRAVLTEDGLRLLVTHAGIYSYRLLPGLNVKEAGERGLRWPPFRFPSAEALSDAEVEQDGQRIRVPGLDQPSIPSGSSVCAVDVSKPDAPRIEKCVPTGQGPRRGRPSGTSHILLTPNRIFVTNALEDSITVLDARSLEPIDEIQLRLPGLEPHRGIIPAGLAWHEASGWLLVAEAGLNAVAVIDPQRKQVLGHIPTAWYPVDVAVVEDRVYVANALGFGFGANANTMTALPPGAEYDRLRGSVTAFVLPDARELPRLTRRVLELNGLLARKPESPARYPAELKHVVLIVKENRSFDEVLGDVEKAANGAVNAAPLLARFGQLGEAAATGPGFQPRFVLRGVNVTPNHHALARRFAFSDNFYSDALHDVEGHLWLNGAYPLPWMRLFFGSPIGRDDVFTDRFAPGRMLFASTHSGLQPEQMPETGTLWDHLERHGVEFLNFGLGLELGSLYRRGALLPVGGRYLANVPLLEPLARRTVPGYPTLNTEIPDVYRAERFVQEMRQRLERGDALPRLTVIYLPNDRLGEPREALGFPYAASYMADNDIAVGRIVEFLSNTPWWRNMVIFITEDDATGGLDHVNAQRVPLLIVSPWARPNYVSHKNVSLPGLLKTIFRILGVPPLHLWDVAATDLSDCFTDEPNFAPYKAEPVAKVLFDPEQALAAFQQRLGPVTE